MNSILKLTLVFAATCQIASAATLHTDDFNDLDPLAPTLKWEGGSSPMRIASGGVSDSAYLQISATGFHLATKNSEDRWTGNYAALGAMRIEVDLMTPAASLPLEMRLVLFGPEDENKRWTSAVAQTIPNDGVWRHYVFSLAESDIVPVLTTASHASLMSDVVQVMLRYDEMADGPDYQGGTVPGAGILGIDNIQLAASTAPPTPGDFDGDHDVDGDDLTKPPLGWTARFGAGLEGVDFLDWQRNFGTPAAALPAGFTVPEPSALAMLAIALTIGVHRRRRLACGG